MLWLSCSGSTIYGYSQIQDLSESIHTRRSVGRGLKTPVEKARETSRIAINIHFIFPQYRLAVTPQQVQRELGRGPQWLTPPVHSGPQKRIEKESNKKLTNELAGLVGESFEEAAKPRAQEVPSVSPAVSDLLGTDPAKPL